MDRIAPSERIQEQIETILFEGISHAEHLAQTGRARLLMAPSGTLPLDT